MRDLPPHVAALQREMTAFSTRPFPDGCDALVVDGVLLEAVDGSAIGCISLFVRQRGELDPSRRAILEGCADRLAGVRPDLPDEEARGYFATLERLAREVLAHVPE